jgi:hypothetical protein
MYSIWPRLSAAGGGRERGVRSVRHGRNKRTGHALVRQVPAARHRPRLGLGVLDVVVPVDEEGLDGANKLDRDVERDWDNVLEGDQTVEEGEEAVDVWIVVRLVGVEEPVGALAVPGDLVEVIDDGADDAGDAEDHEREEAGKRRARSDISGAVVCMHANRVGLTPGGSSGARPCSAWTACCQSS